MWIEVTRIDENDGKQIIGFMADMGAASKLIGAYTDIDRDNNVHPLYTARTMPEGWMPCLPPEEVTV